MLRTHTCGELGELNVGKIVTLCGWVDTYRDHGGGLFLDLRDRYGMTQVVFNPPDSSPGVIEQSKQLRAEYVVKVTGAVAARPKCRTSGTWPTASPRLGSSAGLP